MAIFDSLKKGAKPMPRNLRAAIDQMPSIDQFMAVFLAGVEFVETPRVPVMATDCYSKIFYNRQEIESNPIWTPDILSCVIVHELRHILRRDAEYMLKVTDKDVANVAMDAVINAEMRADGYLFPGMNFVCPEKDSQAQAGAGSGTLYASSRAYPFTPDIYKAIIAAQKKKHHGKKPQPEMGGDIDLDAYKDARKKAGGAKAVESDVRGRAQEAVRVASGMPDRQKDVTGARDTTRASNNVGKGDEEGGTYYSLEKSAGARDLQDLGISIKSPKIRLIRVAGSAVKGLLRARNKRVSSMLTPSPMSAISGRIVAGRRRARTIMPAIAIDASGSIAQTQMDTFNAAAHAWTQNEKASKHAIQCAYFCTEIVASGPLKSFVAGEEIPGAGGGTHFLPVFDWLESLTPRPTDAIIFTDLCAQYPDHPPSNMNVVWIVPPDYLPGGCRFRGMPPFGKCIPLDV